MAAFNFPNLPTLNQQVAGPAGQIYQWDGTKWIAIAGAGGGMTEAPPTGDPYVRNGLLAIWEPLSPIDGGHYT